MRRILRIAGKIVLIVIITIVVFDVAFFLLDPIGVFAYYGDLSKLQKSFEYIEHDGEQLDAYRLPVAENVQMSYWTYTMTGMGRITPDVENPICTIAMVGDSVTFGHGVNDDENFVYLIAEYFKPRDIKVINMGFNQYNSIQVTQMIDYLDDVADVDLYVNLMIENDHESFAEIGEDAFSFTQFSATLTLISYLSQRNELSQQGIVITDAFVDAVNYMATRDDVVLIGMSGSELIDLVHSEIVPINVIDHYTRFNSFVDGHANPEGNVQVADQVIPIIEDNLPAQCR